jgi:anti-sigma factor RsiW
MITEERIFDLIDGNLSDDEKSEVLRELPKHPELEQLYRTLLMTEGYIRANNIEKTSPEFTSNVTRKVQLMINQKKRNSILYRALSIVGLLTIFSFGGAVWLMGSSPSAASDATSLNQMLEVTNLIGSSLTFLSGEVVRNILMVALTFTFFVFMDRILLKHFHMKH